MKSIRLDKCQILSHSVSRSVSFKKYQNKGLLDNTRIPGRMEHYTRVSYMLKEESIFLTNSVVIFGTVAFQVEIASFKYPQHCSIFSLKY